MARAGMAELVTRLRGLVGDPATAPVVYAAWQDEHDYSIGDARRPTSANGHSYRAMVAGTSAALEPTFPTNGTSVIDGTVVWEDQGSIPSGSAVFTDDELQDFLDERRTEATEVALRGIPSVVGGSVVYLTFAAPRRWWDADSVLTDGTDALSPDTEDAVNGLWTFSAAVTSSVFITGHWYDLYGSAAAVCETWAARVAREFDFATDQQSFDRTGKRAGLLAVAREYWRRAVQPGTRPAWRSSDW